MGAYAGALAADALGALAISAVIAVYEGAVRVRSLLRNVTSQAVPAMGVTLGLLAVISLTTSPASVWLLLAFGALLLVAFRTYASLADRHLSLERLYRFSQAVTSSPEIDEVMRQRAAARPGSCCAPSAPTVVVRRLRRRLRRPRRASAPTAG